MRYPGGNRIRVLGGIDHRTLRTWARRLGRRSALGQEVLIRPAKGSPVLLLPQQTEQQTEALRRAGINPALTVATEWNRQDAWIKVTGGNEGDAAKEFHAALIEGGLCAESPNDRRWGHLAGYRPDPRATTTASAQLLRNKIMEIADTVVEVTRDLLERLRSRAKRRPERDLSESLEKSAVVAKEKRRPR